MSDSLILERYCINANGYKLVNHYHFSMTIAMSRHPCHFSLREMESCANGSRAGNAPYQLSHEKFNLLDAL